MPFVDNQDLFSGSYGSFSLTALNGVVMTGAGCYLSMDMLPTNGLSLLYNMPGIDPKAQLSATGLTLTVGPPGVGASIQLTPTGITLQFGPSGAGASIKLDATGITLQAGPTTQIQLTPQGLTLQGLVTQLTANTSLTVTAGLLSETASGAVTRSGMTTTMS